MNKETYEFLNLVESLKSEQGLDLVDGKGFIRIEGHKADDVTVTTDINQEANLPFFKLLVESLMNANSPFDFTFSYEDRKGKTITSTVETNFTGKMIDEKVLADRERIYNSILECLKMTKKIKAFEITDCNLTFKLPDYNFVATTVSFVQYTKFDKENIFKA